jgi:hypothetical protein
MQQPYYVKEKPVEVITEFGEFRYYKEAGKLQVSRPKWKTMDDEIRQGKTVTIDIFRLKGNEELKTFLGILIDDLKQQE